MQKILESLNIENFRSLRSFQVDKLGTVNLIVGKNNAGKSSVLEAIRIFASCAQREVLEQIAEDHDEKSSLTDDDIQNPSIETELPFSNFFSGRQFPVKEDEQILIGNKNEEGKYITITYAHLREFREPISEAGNPSNFIIRRLPISFDKNASEIDGVLRKALLVKKYDKTYRIFIDSHRGPARPIDPADTIKCATVPTSFVSSEDLAREWDSIVFTEYEKVIQEAMRFISPNFEGLAFIESQRIIRSPRERMTRRTINRVPVVKIKTESNALPLNSLGDGMLRILQLVLKISSAKNGFLLIDEFENGLHYSIQQQIWSLIFNLARNLNIQVFATTHSWDCIQNFAAAAQENQAVDGVLFRVGRSARSSDRGSTIATSFTEQQLYDISQSELEVRG